MINEQTARKYCREDITIIKNYTEAIADKTRMWICHHINGEPFTGFCTADLKKMNMYYQRPASELVFVSRSEHNTIHKKDISLSDESRKKMSDALKGRIFSDATRKKMSKSHKGMTGKHWYNNEKINVVATECPEGFVEGRICKEKV